MKITKTKLFAIVLSAIFALQTASSVISATPDTVNELMKDELTMWEHGYPHAITLYKDHEHTEKIIDPASLKLGDKVYYEVVSAEGWYLRSFSVDSSYVDSECFIYEGSFGFAPVSILAGDYNGDLRVNVSDVMWILRYLAHWRNYHPQWTIEEDPVAGDYNRDGQVDVKDAVSILRLISGNEEPYGGAAKDFEGILDITYEVSERIATMSNSIDDCHGGILFTDTAELARYSESLLSPDEALSNIPWIPWYEIEAFDQVAEEFPLDKDALCQKYDESFFEKHDLVLVSIMTHRYPLVELDSFKYVNGVPTAEFAFSPSGVVSGAYFCLNILLVIDKGAISTSADIVTRSFVRHGLC